MARAADLYHGAHTADAPDLTIGFNPGFRAHSATASGGRAATAQSASTRAWSGDHASVDPVLIPGVLFTNRRISGPGARLTDITPTVLAALDLPIPPGLDGTPLLSKPPDHLQELRSTGGR